jgi:type II secretory pathway pseudopilin PulG
MHIRKTRTEAPEGAARRQCARRGFTLIEATLATIIVGVGCVASLNLIAAGTLSNLEGAEQTTGINLARSIREMTVNQTFATVRGLNGVSYSPPKDGRGSDLTQCPGWQQSIAVQAVNPSKLIQDIVDPNAAALRVTVTTKRNGRIVCNLSWYLFAPPS